MSMRPQQSLSCGRRTRAAGFGMIEVMVSLLVIAVALLGTAKIQAVTINATHNSSVRSLAALQAASIAGAMRANEAYWTSSVVPATVASGTGAGTTALDSTLSSPSTSCAGSTITTTPCTATQLAAYDLQGWLAGLTGGTFHGTTYTAVIPNSWANITCATATVALPATCTIQIAWNEKVVAANALTTGGTTTLTYQLVVQP
jgi:type IV pilus assembly protein PilV